MSGIKPARGLKYYLGRLPLLLLLGYLGAMALFYFYQRPMLFMTDRDTIGDPSLYKWNYENVLLDVNGEKTHGWYIPLENARGTVLFSHGNGGSISYWLGTAENLRALGFSVLLYDYGGYGKSTGKASEKRCYADARAMWKWLIETQKVPANKILLFGRSLGGAVTCQLATEVVPHAVVMESTFLSVPDVAAKVFYHMMPVDLLASYRFASKDKIGNIHSPILIIHSPDDTMIPFFHGNRLFELANKPKTFLQIHGDHNFGFAQSADIYRKGWEEFVGPLFPRQ